MTRARFDAMTRSERLAWRVERWRMVAQRGLLFDLSICDGPEYARVLLPRLYPVAKRRIGANGVVGYELSGDTLPTVVLFPARAWQWLTPAGVQPPGSGNGLLQLYAWSHDVGLQEAVCDVLMLMEEARTPGASCLHPLARAQATCSRAWFELRWGRYTKTEERRHQPEARAA